MSDEIVVAKVKWVIENATSCFHKMGDLLESEEFRVPTLGNSLWCLELYPKGDKYDDIAIYLRLWNYPSELTSITISFEITIDDRYCWDHLTKTESNVLFTRGKKCGFNSFVELDNSVFMEECFPGDVLTIFCYISSTTKSMSDDRITKVLLTTHIPVEKASFVWKLKRFSKMKTDQSKNVCFDSPFSPDGLANPLNVTLTMFNFLEEKYVKILVEGDSEYFLKCRLWHDETEEDYLRCSKELSDYPYEESYLPLITAFDIQKYDTPFLDNDTLKLNCEVVLVSSDIQSFRQCHVFKKSDQESIWYSKMTGTIDKDKSKSPRKSGVL